MWVWEQLNWVGCLAMAASAVWDTVLPTTFSHGLLLRLGNGLLCAGTLLVVVHESPDLVLCLAETMYTWKLVPSCVPICTLWAPTHVFGTVQQGVLSTA